MTTYLVLRFGVILFNDLHGEGDAALLKLEALRRSL